MSSKKTDTPESQEKIDRSKRKITRGGLAAPAMLTLVNRSAWGADLCTASGFASGGLSGGFYSPNPLWLNPTEWHNSSITDPGNWPAGYGRIETQSGKYKKLISSETFNGQWKENSSKDLLDVQTVENNAPIKLLVSSTISGSASNAPLYEALTALDKTSFLIGTLLNEAKYGGIPYYFLTGTPTLEEYKAFYSNCIDP